MIEEYLQLLRFNFIPDQHYNNPDWGVHVLDQPFNQEEGDFIQTLYLQQRNTEDDSYEFPF